MSKYTIAVAALTLSACAHVPFLSNGPSNEHREKSAKAAPAVTAREVVADNPTMVVPTSAASAKIWNAALKKPGTRIVISTQGRSLWLMRDGEILMKAPIAVGRTKRLVWDG